MDCFIDMPFFLKDEKWFSYRVGGGFILDPDAPEPVKKSYQKWIKSLDMLKKKEGGTDGERED